MQFPVFTVHEDTDLFLEALSFTAARTGFTARLIEKDYFNTLLLAYLAAAEPHRVSKGGTCLAKVYEPRADGVANSRVMHRVSRSVG